MEPVWSTLFKDRLSFIFYTFIIFFLKIRSFCRVVHRIWQALQRYTVVHFKSDRARSWFEFVDSLERVWLGANFAAAPEVFQKRKARSKENRIINPSLRATCTCLNENSSFSYGGFFEIFFLLVKRFHPSAIDGHTSWWSPS